MKLNSGQRITKFATTEAQGYLLTDLHRNTLEEDHDGGSSAVPSTWKTLKDKGQGQSKVNNCASIPGDVYKVTAESKDGDLEEAVSRNGKSLGKGVILRDTVQTSAWESLVTQLFDKLI